ncbi:MAG: ABC transporter ATP-binding protein [Promethearchaeota archaeon]|nr:MAG: ABC transporter ATP-binding protein [Candidatus Lokiarchaeota archaeon]
MVKITLKNVNKIFDPDVHVLKDINLEIKDKEFMVLVGPSGCGKSTCLNIIAGLEYVTDGKVIFDDVDVTYVPPKERRVAMVFQSYALYPHMNVRENMGFALKLSKMDKREIKERVEEASKLLGISQLLDRKPGELSGGQRQRVALGRSIVRNPTVFLFDEPLSNLDAKLRIQMRGEIIKLQRKLKITQVYVTHDQVEAMSMADRIAILHDGKFQQVGTPSDVYNKPANEFVAGFIGSPSMNFFKAKFESNKLIFGEQELSLSSEIANKVKEGETTRVILGIRPEHIKISPESFENSYEVKVTVVEFLGAETIVTFEFPDGISGMVSASGYYDARMGDTAYIAFPLGKIHVFDEETRNNLVHKSTERSKFNDTTEELKDNKRELASSE